MTNGAEVGRLVVLLLWREITCPRGAPPSCFLLLPLVVILTNLREIGQFICQPLFSSHMQTKGPSPVHSDTVHPFF